MRAADLFLIPSELWQEEKPPIKHVQLQYPVVTVLPFPFFFFFLLFSEFAAYSSITLIYFGSWTMQEDKNVASCWVMPVLQAPYIYSKYLWKLEFGTCLILGA